MSFLYNIYLQLEDYQVLKLIINYLILSTKIYERFDKKSNTKSIEILIFDNKNIIRKNNSII